MGLINYTGRFIRKNFEAIVWTMALIGLYFMPANAGHFTLCPLGAMGISWCPGCGIGHAIHHVLHLQFAEALEHHFLGIFAVMIILYRILQLTIINQKLKLDFHGRQNV